MAAAVIRTGSMGWCDRPLRMMACKLHPEEEWDRFKATASMDTALSSPEVFIALVVAAHAAVLALRLSISLYEA